MEQGTRVTPAGFPSRALALAIDAVIFGCLLTMAVMIGARHSFSGLIEIARADAAGGQPPTREDASRLFAALAAAGVMILIAPFLSAFLLSRQGATPGRTMMALSVRDAETGRLPSFAQALARETLRFFHVLPCILPTPAPLVGALLGALASYDMARRPMQQTWYDRVARTVIVTPVAAPRDDRPDEE